MKEWRMRPIGFIRSSFEETSQIPKGLGAKHTAEGLLEVLPQYETGLTDIEGFSHLFVVWSLTNPPGTSSRARPHRTTARTASLPHDRRGDPTL